ncbi:MAG: hypothetical protein L0J75_01470 [Alkalibacterium sp.]|nr:hypothetical protein [Alkalibacterium sp.]
MKTSTRFNGVGCYDPTAEAMFENEKEEEKKQRRDQQVQKVIGKALSILNRNDLYLMNRLEILDKKTGKKYK